MGHAAWYASLENDWEALFGRYIPDWIAVKDKDVLGDFFKGYSTFYTPQDRHSSKKDCISDIK
jgi:hypothetical protein